MGGEVVSAGGDGLGELVPGELHPVAGIPGEANDHALELLDRAMHVGAGLGVVRRLHGTSPRRNHHPAAHSAPEGDAAVRGP